MEFMMFIYQNHQFKQQVFKGFFALLIGIGLTDFVFAKDARKQPSRSQKNQAVPVTETPRNDLYEKISRTTGISLRQLSNLVFSRGNAKQNKATLSKLSRWVNEKGPQGINQAHQERIRAIQTFCDQNANRIPGCHLQIEDLKQEQADFKALKDKAKTDKKLALYYYMTVFNHTLRSEVFDKAYTDLAKACPEEKINTESCMAKRRGIHHVYDITDKLQQAALAKTRSQNTRKIAGHISDLITVYE